jgi:hypothetical protein
MLFGETVAVYCGNHTEHTDTPCGQNVEFWYVNSFRTSQKTHYVTATKPNRLMLLRERVILNQLIWLMPENILLIILNILFLVLLNNLICVLKTFSLIQPNVGRIQSRDLSDTFLRKPFNTKFILNVSSSFKDEAC